MKKAILWIVCFGIAQQGISQALLYDQTAGITTSGLVAQDFETAYQFYDSRIADDFVVPAGETWYVDSIKAYGFYSTGAAVTTEAGVTFQIYDDNSGQPGNLVYADTIESNLDPDGDGSINAPISTPLQLGAGTYWLALAARKDYVTNGNVTGLWYWRLESSNVGNEALWENLAGGFAAGCTTWTPITDTSCVAVDHGDVVFRVYGCFGSTKPTIDPINDSTFCQGPAITLNASGQGSNLAYLWNTGDTTQSISTDTSGYYAVTVYDTATLCGAKEDAIITVKPVPSYELNDDTICPEVLPYTIFANPANASVTWFDNTTGITNTVTQAGTYWAIYNGFNGCDGGDTMTLTVQEQPDPTFTPGNQIDLCEGDEVAVGTATTYTSYAWGNADDTNTVLESGTTFLVTEGGTYWLDAIASNGCNTTGEFVVVDRPLPEPEIEETFNAALNIRLKTAEEYASYSWSNGDSVRNILVTENGEYTVTVTDQYGCTGTTSFNVTTVGVLDPVALKFDFYPNPTKGVVNFTWPSYTESSSIQLMDASGRSIETISSASGLSQIDLSGLDAGLYFIRIDSPEGQGNVRIVKQ